MSKRLSRFAALFGEGAAGSSPMPSVSATTFVAVFGLVAIILYSTQFSGASAFSVAGLAILLGQATLLSGGLAGFLFGIPRAAAETNVRATEAPLRVNTNLEQISDWLTKILVGVGLTQIREIPGLITGVANFLGPALGNQASSRAFGVGLLSYFGVAGFLIGFVTTRTFFTAILWQQEQALEHSRAAEERHAATTSARKDSPS